MIYGYMGKILRINLSNKEIKKEDLKKEDLKKYIGGSGLGAKYLHELTGGDTDPLGEDNALIFMTGPLTGTKSFSSDRFEVITKSPLTGIYGEANCGGKWGSMLKKSGYDGIVITGKSKTPVYIQIVNKDVKILDASDIWGKDIFETDALFKKKISSKSEVACIGPAGEKLVSYAVISTDGKYARVAGRVGVGAVMGSKKLKAILVSGEQELKLYDPEGLQKWWKAHAKEVATSDVAKILREHGTAIVVKPSAKDGNLPVKNWTKLRMVEATGLGEEQTKKIFKRKYFCGSCLVGCGRTVEIENGKYKTDGEVGGLEYESLAMLGPNLLISDIEAINKMNDICNMYGIDTITTGSVLGMTMECYEKGLLSKDELDGIDLKWGHADNAIKMLHKIGKNEGIGKLLGKGTREMAKEIGSYAEEFAMHVKGLEIPAHSPRHKMGNALSYATSNRGACHLSSHMIGVEGDLTYPDMGYPERIDKFSIEGKGEIVSKFENLMCMYDSVPSCKFIMVYGITLGLFTEALQLVTGFDLDKEAFLKTGERIFNLKRLYNAKCGITRKDDALPSRTLTLKLGTKNVKDKLPPIGQMLNEYYKFRGWDEIGIPTARKIKELGLNKYAKD